MEVSGRDTTRCCRSGGEGAGAFPELGSSAPSLQPASRKDEPSCRSKNWSLVDYPPEASQFLLAKILRDQLEAGQDDFPRPPMSESRAWALAHLPGLVRRQLFLSKYPAENVGFDVENGSCNITYGDGNSQRPGSASFPVNIFGVEYPRYDGRSDFKAVDAVATIYERLPNSNKEYLLKVKESLRQLGLVYVRKEIDSSGVATHLQQVGSLFGNLIAELDPNPGIVVSSLTRASDYSGYVSSEQPYLWGVIEPQGEDLSLAYSGDEEFRMAFVYRELFDLLRQPNNRGYSLCRSFCALGLHCGFGVKQLDDRLAFIFTQVPSVDIEIPLGLVMDYEPRSGVNTVTWGHHSLFRDRLLAYLSAQAGKNIDDSSKA